MRKAILFILIIVLFVTLFQPAFATTAENITVSPRYVCINNYAASLTVDESIGVANCSAWCYSVAGYTVEVSCTLQRKENSTWKTIKSWTSTGLEYASVDGYWAVYSGYIYRNLVIYTIRDSSGNIIEVESVTRAYNYPG